MTGTLEPWRGSTVTTTCTGTPVDDASWATADHRPLASAATATNAPAIRWGLLIEASLGNSGRGRRQRYSAEMKPVNVKNPAKKAGVVALVASPKLSFPRAEILVTNSSSEPRIVETRLLELNSQCHLMTMPIDSPRARICRQRSIPFAPGVLLAMTLTASTS